MWDRIYSYRRIRENSVKVKYEIWKAEVGLLITYRETFKTKVYKSEKK